MGDLDHNNSTQYLGLFCQSMDAIFYKLTLARVFCCPLWLTCTFSTFWIIKQMPSWIMMLSLSYYE